MSTGPAPSLMLDLAAAQIQDRQRLAREQATRATARRARAARLTAGRVR